MRSRPKGATVSRTRQNSTTRHARATAETVPILVLVAQSPLSSYFAALDEDLKRHGDCRSRKVPRE
jgi:hypothetical protein